MSTKWNVRPLRASQIGLLNNLHKVKCQIIEGRPNRAAKLHCRTPLGPSPISAAQVVAGVDRLLMRPNYESEGLLDTTFATDNHPPNTAFLKGVGWLESW